jgi:Zn-dependent protease
MFRLLGFDVQVRPGFIVFMLLIVFLYGDEFGLWLAGSLAAFTLLHELGHALAARRAGAHAAISLDFLAGYTSYRPTRAMSRSRRAFISFAGPGIHIGVSVGLLLAMGVNPVDRESIGQSAATVAIWWAGPVIGLFNLVPVLPLDGGHIAQSGLEATIGDRAQRAMVAFSLAATGGFAVWCLIDPDRRFYAIFVAFLLIAQVQMWQSLSTRTEVSQAPLDRRLAAAADAERSAWRTGRSGMLLPGQELSPWYRAHRAVVGGRSAEARQLIVDDLSEPGPRRWWPPDAASPKQLDDLVALLPRPLPTGNPLSEQVLAEVLLRTGDRAAAGYYAADTFSRTRSPSSALLVARASAALGDRDTAVKWLRAAAESPEVSPTELAQAIDRASELESLRHDTEFRHLRAALGSP